jgi:hypothetical protein
VQSPPAPGQQAQLVSFLGAVLSTGLSSAAQAQTAGRASPATTLPGQAMAAASNHTAATVRLLRCSWVHDAHSVAWLLRFHCRQRALFAFYRACRDRRRQLSQLATLPSCFSWQPP